MSDDTLANWNVPHDVRLDLEALCLEYLYRVDHEHFDQVPELFTSDGTFETPWSKMEGERELVEGWKARGERKIKVRHFLGNVRLSMSEADRAQGCIGFTLYQHDEMDGGTPEPKLVAEHLDVYERGPDQRWRFKSRRVVPVFAAESFGISR